MPYKDPERQREYNKQWVAHRRAEYFADKSCVRCGAAEDLELDHRDPKQKVNHRIWSWSTPRREAELAKCQVLCVPCHRNKTSTERDVPIRHGTERSYKLGCRQPCCAEQHLRRKQEWRSRRRNAGLPVS